MKIYEQLEKGVREKYEISDEAEVSIDEQYRADECDLCGIHEEKSVEIYWYITTPPVKKRKYGFYTFNGSLMDLIKELDNDSN